MSNLIQIKKILENYNKSPKKSLGQNFLTDPALLRKTAEIGAEGKNSGVLEIGPGPGTLTRELCGLCKRVAAVEIDKTFEPVLCEMLRGFDNYKVIFDDILKVGLPELVKKEFRGCETVSVCANLPYYITTPVILKLIKSGVKFSSITLMLQKEAAEKLCSKAGEARYNAAAASIGYFGEAKIMFKVPQSGFYPQPKVSSAVIKIKPHDPPAAGPRNAELMFKIINAAFGKRRKTLINALACGLGIDKEKIADIVKNYTGNENIRGEELNIKMFADISDLLYGII